MSLHVRVATQCFPLLQGRKPSSVTTLVKYGTLREHTIIFNICLVIDPLLLSHFEVNKTFSPGFGFCSVLSQDETVCGGVLIRRIAGDKI